MTLTSSSGLILFVKNPVAGKVKTRLASSIGNQNALQVYNNLLSYTYDVAIASAIDPYIFYSDFIQEPPFSMVKAQKEVQFGSDLGERMCNAFQKVLRVKDKAVIIGSDCPEIKANLIITALEKLDDFDLVIGPAEDGGYYLLGMKDLQEEIFIDMPWSAPELLQTTIDKAIAKGLRVHLLPELCDIDSLADLQRFPQFAP